MSAPRGVYPRSDLVFQEVCSIFLEGSVYSTRFTGLGGAPGIFKRLPDRSQTSLTVVVERAESLFTRLQALLKHLQPSAQGPRYVGSANVNVRAVSDNHCV